MNASGRYNVPFGRYDKPMILNAGALRAAHHALANAMVHRADYSAVTSELKKGDFAYFDPPYVPVSKTANFTAYSGRFGPEQQEQLAAELATLRKRGVRAIDRGGWHDHGWTRPGYLSVAARSHSRLVVASAPPSMNSPQLPTDSLPVRVGDVLADKYRVERVLGTGGMGFVVAARNINLGKLVALKMMLPAALGMPQAVARFEREARAAVQLKSEHIAEVLDIGRLPTGEPYIVMELLEGSDFEGLLTRDRRLPVDDAVDYVLQACEAVSEAHALGVVHRDLKPKNLFLSHRLDGTPLVKVLDFGISKWTTTDSDSHSLTRTTDVFGSPNYMSPEQIRSARDVDGRTDIWSLGVILFELLTGRVPFVAVSLPQLCALVLEQPAPTVSTLRADVPEGLVAVVARCLEKSCERRFQSVRELVTALLPFGRVRSQLRSTGGSQSPSASTMAIVTTPHVRPPPPFSSAGDPHIISNGTNAAWINTSSAADGHGRHALVVAIFAFLLLAAGGVVWAGSHLRGSFARVGEHDASTAATASTSASVVSTEPPAASVSVPSAPPSASAGPEVKLTSSAKRPVPPPLTALRDSGAVSPPPVIPSAPPSDPFAPGDRK